MAIRPCRRAHLHQRLLRKPLFVILTVPPRGPTGRAALFRNAAHRTRGLAWRQGAAGAIAIAAAVLDWLVGEAAMIPAIRSGSRGGPTIAEFRGRGVAERPAAHRLFQLDDCHPERHRHDDAFESLAVSSSASVSGASASAVAPRIIRGA